MLSYSLVNDKKDAQKIWSYDLVHEEPYRVAHQGYILMSPQGNFDFLLSIFKRRFCSAYLNINCVICFFFC